MKIPQHFIMISLLVFLLFLSSKSIAKSSLIPYSLLLPVYKDESSRQYLTQIYQINDSFGPVNLTIDLGGRFPWLACEDVYGSYSTFKSPLPCNSSSCKHSGSQSCYYRTCTHILYNPISGFSTNVELHQDHFGLWYSSTYDGPETSNSLIVSEVIFGCADTYLLQGLAYGIKGMAGLGNGYIGLPSQLARDFRLPRKFAICLSSSTTSNGVIFIGDDSLYASVELTYTPLLKNPVSTAGDSFPGESSVEYFIGVKKIIVNGQILPINCDLLAINKDGVGGTKISTVVPYGTMETSIYNAFKNEVRNAIEGVPIIEEHVSPFDLCYDLDGRGLIPPRVSLVLEGDNNPTWDLFVENFMVFVDSGNSVLCLGFVDGGENPQTSIVLGGLQIEENLLEFDLVKKRMGFTPMFLTPIVTCNNFNVTFEV